MLHQSLPLLYPGRKKEKKMDTSFLHAKQEKTQRDVRLDNQQKNEKGKDFVLATNN